MTLYHGDTEIVKAPAPPDVRLPDVLGGGFCFFSSFAHAMDFACTSMVRKHEEVGYVSVFDLDYEKLKSRVSVSDMRTTDEKWLDFVLSNRNLPAPRELPQAFALPCIDNKTYMELRRLELGIGSPEEVLRAAAKRGTSELFGTLYTKEALDCCTFLCAKIVPLKISDDDIQLSHIMPHISLEMTKHVISYGGFREKAALNVLYNSETYSMLEHPESGLWRLSTPMLNLMLESELSGRAAG